MAAVIIPARGGSRGIPYKQIVPVGGIPLVERAIRTALEADVGEVFASTEDERIAEVIVRAGGRLIERPAELSRSTASSESVMQHAMQYTDADVLVMMQCTSPFTLPEQVREAVAGASDGVSTVTVSPFTGFVWMGDKRLIYPTTEAQPMRQQMRGVYWETGALYGCTRSVWAKGRRFAERQRYVIVSEDRAADINNAYDLEMARQMAHDLDAGLGYLRPDLRGVQTVILDFDGVVTDNRVWTDGRGNELVCCSKDDSTGFLMLRRAGVRVVVLTHEMDASVRRRCEKLGIGCVQTEEPKEIVLQKVMRVDLSRAVYVGNDMQDLGCMGAVRFPVAVGDARNEVKRAARVVLQSHGGRGAVRELAEMVCDG